MLRELITRNRSYRRFDQSVMIDAALIRRWIELARFSASGRNMQSLKYVICTSKETAGEIFPCLGWAGYLTGWGGPAEGERPAAYVAIVHDRSLSDKYYCDDGIAAQSILLGAVESGYGGCIIGSVNKTRVSEILGLPDHLAILWIIALGKPVENVVIEDCTDGDIRYWRDENQVHHVPKRTLGELVFKTIE